VSGGLEEGKEEGRAANKSPHQKFGYFLSLSQQAVSADIIPNSAIGIFSHLVLNIHCNAPLKK